MDLNARKTENAFPANIRIAIKHVPVYIPVIVIMSSRSVYSCTFLFDVCTRSLDENVNLTSHRLDSRVNWTTTSRQFWVHVIRISSETTFLNRILFLETAWSARATWKTYRFLTKQYIMYEL